MKKNYLKEEISHMRAEGKVQDRQQGAWKNIYLQLQLRGWVEATQTNQGKDFKTLAKEIDKLISNNY